jgi:hypothetical protein
VEKYGTARRTTDDSIIQRMCIPCWITKATDTHSEYVILIAFLRQHWLRESVRLYVHCLSCVFQFSSASYSIYVQVITLRYKEVFSSLSSPVMFADFALGCSLKVDKCTAPSDVHLSARLRVCTNCLPVCAPQCDCSHKRYVH